MNSDQAARPNDDPDDALAQSVDSRPVAECPIGLPEPLVRAREEHNISRRDIDPDALKVLYRLSRNNYTAYLVGGGVRDLMLGRKPKDFDISTNAKPEEIRALFRNCILIGRRFRLAHIRYGDKIIETSTFRSTPACTGDPADPDADLFQRDDNLFGTPQEDALRRDFTVNGLFYDIGSFSVIDYVGGMEDLAARRIRCIGDPCIRFREDPVRMIRAVRFASRLDFELDPDTRDAILRHGEELAKASPARLLEEITRLFAFSAGEKAVRLLNSTGLLRVILPEVADSLESGAIDTDMFWQRLHALDEGDTVLPDATPALIFSVLLVDPLKLYLGRDWPLNDFPRLKFDKVHAFLEPLAQRLRFPRKLVDRIVHLYLAQHRFLYTGGKRGSIANFVTQDSFHEALALAEIVQAAGGKPRTGLNHWRDMLAERIYGREEGRGDEHRRMPLSEGGEEALESIRLDEPKQGKRLSRSARRRRNKKLRRQRQDGPEQAVEENRLPNGEKRKEAAPAPDAAAVEAVSQPVAKEDSEPVQVPVQPVEEERKKAARPKAKRTRTRKKEEPVAEVEVRQLPAEAAPAPEVEAEAFQPLTAAAFYAVPAEPEKKRKRVGKAKGSPKKAKLTESGKPSVSAESARLWSSPPAMDKADEADTPMHWLDEI